MYIVLFGKFFPVIWDNEPCIIKNSNHPVIYTLMTIPLRLSKLTIIGSNNVVSPGQHQAIIWTSAWLLSVGALGTNFSEISIKLQNFSFTKTHLNISSAKWRPFCPKHINSNEIRL